MDILGIGLNNESRVLIFGVFLKSKIVTPAGVTLKFYFGFITLFKSYS